MKTLSSVQRCSVQQCSVQQDDTHNFSELTIDSPFIIDYNASVGVTAPVSARLFANNLVTTYQHEHLVNIVPDTIKMLAQAVARCPGFQPPLRHARGATTVRYQVGCVDTCLAVYLKRHVHAIRATFAQDCPDLDV